MIWLVGEANLQGVGLWSALPTPITFLLWKHLGAFGILASPYFSSRRKIRARPVQDLRGQVAGHWGVGRARGGPQRLQQSLLQPRARRGAAEIHPLPLRSLADYTPPLPSRPKLRLRLRLQFATSSAAATKSPAAQVAPLRCPSPGPTPGRIGLGSPHSPLES